MFIVLFLASGTAGVLVRLKEAEAKIAGDFVPISRDPLMITDCSFDLRYRKWPEGIQASWLSPPQDLRVGSRYALLSQTYDLEAVKKLYRDGGYAVDGKAVPIHEESSRVGFIAYDPWNFLFNRTNGFYYYLFDITEVRRLDTP